MTLALLLSILATGFGLGLVHALDADHLMTIASLSARQQPGRATLRYAVLWALGHGGLLVGVVAAVVLFGWTLPHALPAGAERGIGLILVAAGASALWLRHPPHGHRRGLREKAPFLIGLVHGLAGSAAMLALVPTALYSPLAGLAYAAVFSVGVLAGMMGFAIALDRLRSGMVTALPRARRGLEVMLGLGAIGMGAHWLAA